MQEKKVTILGNELAQLPSVSSKDKLDVLIDKIVKAMGLRKEGQQ